MNGLCPRPHASGHFRFSLQCTRKRRFRTPKTQAFKKVPQSGSFRKRRLLVCVRTKTEVFEHNDTCNDVTHTTLPLRLLCKRYYRIFIVLVFSCEPAKMIQIRYVQPPTQTLFGVRHAFLRTSAWEATLRADTKFFGKRRKKISVFKKSVDTCGPGLISSPWGWSLNKQKAFEIVLPMLFHRV